MKYRSIFCRLWKPRNGFTLIELLVVISIIALLLSILMPALSRAREHAREVVCHSNLRQFGTVFYLYAGDNNGSFPPGMRQLYGVSRLGAWNFILEPYYENPDLMLCPSASMTMEEGGVNPHQAWTLWNAESGNASKVHTGSYGINRFIYNPPSEWQFISGSPTRFSWRRVERIRDARNVPVLLDSWWNNGGPSPADTPATNVYFGYRDGGENSDQMNRFVVPRHLNRMGGLFADFSVRQIGIKELWKLRWNTRWDTRGWRGAWPEWIDRLEP